MTVVLMNPSASLLVLANTFHGLATEIVRLERDHEAVSRDLLDAYAAVTCAYAAALRDRVTALPDESPVWPDVIDHLLMRLHQSRAEEILLDPLEVRARQLDRRERSAPEPRADVADGRVEKLLTGHDHLATGRCRT